MPRLDSNPIHLGLGATAIEQPEFPHDERAMQWYADYAERHAADGEEARIMAMYTFTESWPMWEMHPAGGEVVLCTKGTMTLHQEFPDGSTAEVTIGPGEYVINPPGTWHTADITGEASAVFVTAGMGTQHRPR